MDKLAANMSTITEFSEKITGTLQGKRQQITKLSGVHALLKKVLHFSVWFSDNFYKLMCVNCAHVLLVITVQTFSFFKNNLSANRQLFCKEEKTSNSSIFFLVTASVSL